MTMIRHMTSKTAVGKGPIVSSIVMYDTKLTMMWFECRSNFLAVRDNGETETIDLFYLSLSQLNISISTFIDFSTSGESKELLLGYLLLVLFCQCLLMFTLILWLLLMPACWIFLCVICSVCTGHAGSWVSFRAVFFIKGTTLLWWILGCHGMWS